jgi:predicted nuclease of predicted toxin-antitoxin system
VKLRLDEMYSHVIAEQLRARGHDADAVVEHAELRGLADTDIFALAQTEQRTVVTENIPDFSDIATDYGRPVRSGSREPSLEDACSIY